MEIYKAQPLTPHHRVPDLAIFARESVPSVPNPLENTAEMNRAWSEANYAFYREQAGEIINRLVRSLPGGVIDQILIELMRQKASHFKVPFVETKPDAK